MFRRRRQSEDDEAYIEGGDDGSEETAGTDADTDEASGDEPREPVDPARPAGTGPWDEADTPQDDVTRVDLGGLLVPADASTELRVDVDPETGLVVSVTLATPTSVMSVGAFAAPRSSGIWREIRDEISTSLAGSGGRSEEVAGPYGVELRAQVPTEVAGQLAPARFVGADGPRWFVRAMLQGRAAAEDDADPQLLAAFGQLVVRRGSEAMVVRDAIPLRLPEGVGGSPDPADPAEPAEQGQPDLSLPERGPEITEIR